jgi:YVTN family beta-propeller protein
MIDLPGRPGFDSVGIANGMVVASHTAANTVDIFDPQKRRMVAQITNIAQPRGIAVDAKNNRFYVAAADSVINVVSSQDWQVKDNFKVEGSPDVLALSPDGLRLYVGDKTNSSLMAVDTALRKTIATSSLPGRPEEIAIGDGGVVYITVQDAASIIGLDRQLNTVAQFKLQASQPTGIAYDAASKRLYVAVRAAVLALDAGNGTELARVPAPRGVNGLYLDPASHVLFATGGGSVIALNTARGLTSLDELPADVKGHAFVYDASRKLLFLPGGREGRSKMLIVRDLAGGPAEPAASEAALH